MSKVGFYAVPLIMLAIIISGFLKKVRIFEIFVSGANQGFNSTLSLAPSLIGLIVAVSMLKSSGALDIICQSISPITKLIGVPKEVVPLCMLRPISGSGSLAIVNSILKNYGADSFIGKLASIISGSTETTFYTLAIYFGSIGIKNSRHALPSALIADAIAIFASIITLNYFFKVP